MEKQRKWHFFLILTVIALTIYNISPTIFYYAKPLKQPLSESMALDLSSDIVSRVNQLEQDSMAWISSFCDLLQIKPAAVSLDANNSQFLTVRFSKAEEASRFRHYLPRAGSLIPFAPAGLSLVTQNIQDNPKTVLVQRKIPIRLDPSLFSFADRTSSTYQQIILDRASQIGAGLAGPTESALMIAAIEQKGPGSIPMEWIYTLASQINALENLPEGTPLYARTAASFTQGHFTNRSKAIQSLASAFDYARDEIKRLKAQAAEEDLSLLEKQESSLIAASSLLKKHPSLFSNGQDPWSAEEIAGQLQSHPTVQLGTFHPLFASLSIDWGKETIQLKLHADVAKLRAKKTNESVEQLLINELAKTSRMTNELFINHENVYASSFHQNPETRSLLVLGLDGAAKKITAELLAAIKTNWHPKHPDLSEENFPIVDFAAYQTLPAEQKALCLVAYAPATIAGVKPAQIHNQSIYFLAKGIHRIAKNYEQFPNSELAKTFQADLQSLQELLRQHGFAAYWGASFPLIEDLASDIVFEQHQFFSTLLAATRENFQVQGTKKYAVLELSNLEQRILATNKIETQIHEDLVKWNDDYQAASVNLDPSLRYDVPKPTKNIVWDNLILNFRKIIRGDERKIIRWGLDLSGGKTVQLELRDSENRPVTADADLKQGMSELYQRVSKMGVSEVSIRQVGHQIVLDFPGSQALSGSELVRASTMYFHIVNEKFSTQNPALANVVNRFLEEVWNEAQVTFRTDPKGINEIAWKHLYNSGDPANPQPRSEAGRTLLEHGFRLQAPDDLAATNALNDTASKIVVYRGRDFSEWHGQSHPLLVVFHNYALEGSNLENIRSSYDPAKGNFLSFDVAGSSLNRDGKKTNPRDDLQAWSARYSKPKVAGTPNEAYSRGQGWRMAVVLNDSVIASPTLNDSLRDSAMISGSFSQREVTQLATDLKAGSLTFTPHILSEKNVSPELGKTDRTKGITATFVALLLVIGSMIAYYRFAGLIASIAVIFNILIMWATLQNLGATLSLAGIAGLILTVGMAVDANVLVFERIKEEFAATGHIASAIREGYKKAFSAILDSNVTTIIAALILLNFDAGPIKAFAITLIIGIVSSLFTALFVTRFYFTGWVQNPKNKILSMANWIHATQINFLRWTKLAFILSGALILLGGYFAVQQRSTLLGMDFTGGFSLNLDMQQDEAGNYAARVENALLAQGLVPQDFQIRELSPSHQLRVLFSTSLEQPKKVFADMPLTNDRQDTRYAYQKNPRIEWAVQALSAQGLSLSESSLPQLHTNWTATSGQMSDSMRNNALTGLLIAFVCIFFYIAVRFEYKFAIAASLCLLHDVLITLGIMGLLHVCGVKLQIDLNTVAALMTIIGYSLNDTIIVFDRIREDMEREIELGRKTNLFRTVNHALNSTLSRTSITSGTTLLVLLALVLLGGSSIFSFALVMTIGVIFGTLSSWFIASPIMLYFHKKEEEHNSPGLYTEKNAFEWKRW